MHVDAFRILGQYLAKLGDCFGIEPALGVEVAQGGSVEFEALGLDPIALAIEPSEHLADLAVSRRQLKGALELPDGLVRQAILIVGDAQPHIGDIVVRRGAQDALEQVRGFLIVALFEARFGKHAIGFDVPGMLLQYVPTDGDGLIIGSSPDEFLGLIRHRLQPDFHGLPSLVTIGSGAQLTVSQQPSRLYHSFMQRGKSV